MNEGIFPTKHADTQDKLEEERRLAYVAYTRAENALFLSDAEGINYDGSFRYPSRFIFNTEKTYLNYTVELEDKLVNDSNTYIQNTEKRFTPVSLEVGDTIQHSLFGKGEILEIRDDISSYVIKFEKLETARNINFKMPLQKI